MRFQSPTSSEVCWALRREDLFLPTEVACFPSGLGSLAFSFMDTLCTRWGNVPMRRASITGEIVMDNVFCPEETAFPEVRGLFLGRAQTGIQAFF